VKNIGAHHENVPATRPVERPGMLTVRPLADRAGLRLEGEADFTVQPQIRAALAALLPTPKIQLDLTGLDFIDIAAARELIAVTQQPFHSCLILHDPPPALLRLIRLLWPEANVEFGLSRDKIVDCDGEASGWRQKRSQAVAFVSHWLPRPATSCPR
jgi:anti-anti-sigma regulatory factor